jgi:DNA-binding transcriptional MerR regulator
VAYTIQKLANLAGVSVRTLRFYDQINLLKPNRDINGYRVYDDKEITKLQQILFFRELEFALEEIKKIVDSPKFDILQALNDQKKLVELEITKLEDLLKTINKTIQKTKGEIQMNDKELYGNLTKEEVEQYKKEVREKYGDFNDKTENWSTKDFGKIAKQQGEMTQAIADLFKKGLDISDKEVQYHIAKHYEFTNVFFECSIEAYKNLGKLYIEDKRFTSFYDKYSIGLAQFMCDAIEYYCDNLNC